MPVSNTSTYTESTANGVSTVFPYDFTLLDEADLVIEVDGVEVASGFTVSGVGDAAGGNITFSVAPANGATVLRYRDIPLQRSTDYQYQGELPSATLDEDFDRLWLAIQQVNASIGRGPTLPVGAYPGVSLSLPAPVALGFWRWNAGATAIEYVTTLDANLQPVSTFSGTLLEEVSAAAWRTALSLYSAAQIDAAITALDVTLSADIAAAAAAAVRPYLEYRDEKASGTEGGAATSGSWFTRTLNTESADSAGIGSLAANVITLPAGTYECDISVPGCEVDTHQARLYNVTGTAVLLYGSTANTSLAGTFSGSSSRITGRFTLAGATDIRVEQRVASSRLSYGLGHAGSFGNVEVYTVARFWKIN